jgi:surface antigen
MTTAGDILATARSQLGTCEKPPGSNMTPYGAAYGGNGQAWCAKFVWWVFRQSHASQLIPKAAYTPAFADWFRTHHQWGTTPRPGAVVFFDFPNDGVNRISHVGIVEAVNKDGTIQTIEGNTTCGNAGSQREGDGVWRRTRRTGIAGYGYPAYDGGNTVQGVVPGQRVVPDQKVDPVRRTQAAVHVDVDGEWGPVTDAAVSLVRRAAQGHLGDVRATQRAVGTTVDGDWGPASRKALTATVRALQGAWGAAADGDWGPQTDGAWASARKRFGKGL